jgi:hypothetical protein
MINNYVRLNGMLEVFKLIDTSTGPMLKARIKIPEEHTNNVGIKSVYHTSINIQAWGDLALSLDDLDGEWVSIEGNIETNRYEKGCSKCNYPTNMYWTYIRISNFVAINKPFGDDIEFIYE